MDIGVSVKVVDGGGSITTDLHKHIGKVRADALESLLLALAVEGVDITSETFDRAISTAVESIANHS